MGKKHTICTGQHYESRVFESQGASPSQVRAAVSAYVEAIEGQSGLAGAFRVSGSGEAYSVDMSRWPEGEGFGGWFAELMREHKVEVYD